MSDMLKETPELRATGLSMAKDGPEGHKNKRKQD